MSCFLMFGSRGSLFINRPMLTLIAARIPTWPMLVGVIGTFSYTQFIMATGYIDVSIVGILFDTWPVGSVLIMSWLFRHERIYTRNWRIMAPMFGLAFIGGAFLILSQSGSLDASADSLPNLVKGVGLGRGAAAFGTLGCINFL